METPVTNSSGIDLASDAIEPSAPSNGFSVHLANFDGPFDLLLQLISRHKLDITEISLSLVTDEFISFIRALELSGEGWRLDQATEFLVVAATLLDLKAARLLPSGEVEDEEDIAVLEARDLLLARLLQYRAFKEMSADFKHRLATAGRQHPRAAGLDEKFAKLLPEVELGMGPDDFANLAARALEPKLPDIISVAHIHAARVSVREQAAIIVERLRRVGQASFRTLTRDCDTTLLVVARFLALLEIYRDGLVTFDQPTPLGELYVRWIGDDDLDANSLREIDEFDTTEVQDFRTQLGDVEASEQVDDEIGDQPNE